MLGARPSAARSIRTSPVRVALRRSQTSSGPRTQTNGLPPRVAIRRATSLGINRTQQQCLTQREVRKPVVQDRQTIAELPPSDICDKIAVAWTSFYRGCHVTCNLRGWTRVHDPGRARESAIICYSSRLCLGETRLFFAVVGARSCPLQGQVRSSRRDPSAKQSGSFQIP